MAAQATDLTVVSDGVELSGEQSSPPGPESRPIVLLHGLTATRRYVVMGSRALERSGHRVIAYDLDGVPAGWRATIETVLRQRLEAHEHPLAVAEALEVVPRSRPFEDMAELAAIEVPTVVVASRDDADPGHPLAVGERYARAIPGAGVGGEGAGAPARSPIAWQGGRLSAVLAELVSRGYT